MRCCRSTTPLRRGTETNGLVPSLPSVGGGEARPFGAAAPAAGGPVHRAALFRRADDDHYLLLTVHHIVSDYWTLGVLMDELNTIYRAVRAGAPVPLPPPERSYADFVAWQQDLLAGPDGERLWD